MTVRLYFEVDQGELIRAHEYCSNVEPPIEIDPAVWGHTFFEMPVFFEVDGVSLLSFAQPLFGTATGLEWTLRVVKHVGAWDFTSDGGGLFFQLDENVLSILNPHLRSAVWAPIGDVDEASAKFSKSVRAFMLKEFPSLDEHRQIGWWFRGEPPPNDRFQRWLPEPWRVDEVRGRIRRLLNEIAAARDDLEK